MPTPSVEATSARLPSPGRRKSPQSRRCASSWSGWRQSPEHLAIARDGLISGADVDAGSRVAVGTGFLLRTRILPAFCHRLAVVHHRKGPPCKFVSLTMRPASHATGALVVPFFSDKALDGVGQGDRCRPRRRDRRRARSPERSAGKPGEHALVHAKDAAVSSASSLIALGERAKLRAERARALRRHAPSAISGTATSRRSRSCCRCRPQARGRCAPRCDRRRRDRRHRSTTTSIAPSPTAGSRRPRSRSSPAASTRRRSRRERARHGARRSGELRAPTGADAGQRHDADAPRRRGEESRRTGRARVRRARRSARWQRRAWARCSRSRGAATKPPKLIVHALSTAIRRAKNCSRSSAKG